MVVLPVTILKLDRIATTVKVRIAAVPPALVATSGAA
jgi:hypothetical protein